MSPPPASRESQEIALPCKLQIYDLRPSFMAIGFESEILLDLVLFADRTNAELKSYLSILWDLGGLQRFERRVYIFLAVCS